MTCRWSFFASLLVLSSALARPQDAIPDKKPSYEAMVEKVKAGDKSMDFRELRLAYVNSETHTHAKDTDPEKKAMTEALRDKNFDNAIKNAEAVLKENYVDIDAHFAEYVAYSEQRKSERAELQKYIFEGLLHSITGSGDGKSPTTAFQVIEVHEEYVVLRFSGLMPQKQILMERDGHSYDVMETVDREAHQKVTLYFNVDIPFSRYGK